MNVKKEEKQITSLQLTKDSAPEIVKNYFEKILELKQTGKEFPINLNDAWALAYARKQEAVRALKTNFIENVHYQVLRQNAQNSEGGRPVDEYWLTVDCLEYFIASKVHPVFEVYRRVFHATIEGGKAKAQAIESKSHGYTENTVITVKMGTLSNQIYVTEGAIYTKFSPIMKYLGYTGGSSTQYIDRIGRQYFRLVKVGLQDAWFINIDGFDALLQMTTLPISGAKLSSIYRDVYGVEMPERETPFAYRYTATEMNEIYELLFEKPIKKERLFEKLRSGKMEGGLQ